MLGLGLGLAKGNFISNFAKTLYRQYVVRVTAAGGVFQNAVCALNRLLGLNSQSLLKQASLVLIPDGIKEDVVFSQVPTSGLGDLSFTRASDATYTDSTGVVRRSPYNLALWSEMFSDASWVKTGTTITPNTTTAPTGTLTADTMSIVDSNSRITQSLSLGAGTYTISAYVKVLSTTTAGFMRFQSNVDGININSFFTPTTEWARYTTTVTAATGLTSIVLRGAAGGFVGDVAIWGVQLVQGTEALDYFPTTNRQDVPRIDFRNADGTLSSCGRLLLEPQRTNLVPNGLGYNAATGVAYNTTVSGSPMAGVNCARITKNEAAGTLRYANQPCSNSALTGSTAYVLSAFFKYDGVDFDTTMEFNDISNFGNIGWRQVINIASTGITLGTSTSCTSTIENWGSGWYRVNVRITTGAAPSGSFVTYLMRLPSTLSTGQGFLHALPQFEAGAYQTTYIPTTTAAVTRLADVASKTGVSSLIGQEQGTLFYEFSVPLNESLTRSIGVTDGTVANRINISVFATALFARVDVGGVNQVNSNATIVPTAMNKVAFRYKANDFAAYVNGVKVITDTSGSTFSGTTLSSFSFIQPDGTSAFNGNVGQIAFFKTALTDDQLEVLTSEGYGTYALLAQSLNYVLQ